MIHRLSYRFDSWQSVVHVVAVPLYVPNVGGELSDIIQMSELSRRTLIEVLVKREYGRFVVGENDKTFSLDDVWEFFDRGVHRE